MAQTTQPAATQLPQTQQTGGASSSSPSAPLPSPAQQQSIIAKWINPTQVIIVLGLSAAAAAIGVLYGRISARQNDRNLRLTVWRVH